MITRRFFALFLALAFVFVLTGASQQKSEDTAVDPVCGMTVKKAEAKATYEYNGTTYYFCNAGCKDSFAKDPEKYLKKQTPQAQTGMMQHPQGQMMQHKMAGAGGGCPMMKGGSGHGCCGMMGQGMMAGGCENCPMMSKHVEKKVENTSDGVTIRLTSKNPETVKAIQEHAARMAAGCPMMKGPAQKEAPKEEKK